MRSSVVTYYVGTEPGVTDEDGNALGLPPGYVIAGTIPAVFDPAYPDADRLVLHIEPGKSVPDDALQVIVDGNVSAWDPYAVAGQWSGAVYVLEAEYTTTDDEGNAVRARCKVADLPDGVEPVRTNIVPHVWAGEQAA